MKKGALIAAVILAVLVCVFLAKNFIVKGLLSQGIKAMTGLSLRIGSLDLGVFKSAIAVKDLKLFNPPEYPDNLMVDLPEFYVDYDLGSCLKGKVHLRQLRLNLKLFEVVKTREGKINLDSLKALQPKGNGPAPKIRIDELVLDIEKVLYKDYSRGGKPKIAEFDVRIHETFRDVEDTQALASIIVSKALMHTTVADLAKFNMKPIEQVMEGAVGKTGKLLKGTAGEAEKSVRGVGSIFKGLLPGEK